MYLDRVQALFLTSNAFDSGNVLAIAGSEWPEARVDGDVVSTIGHDHSTSTTTTFK